MTDPDVPQFDPPSLARFDQHISAVRRVLALVIDAHCDELTERWASPEIVLVGVSRYLNDRFRQHQLAEMLAVLVDQQARAELERRGQGST
jgi:hypothetical protein